MNALVVFLLLLGGVTSATFGLALMVVGVVLSSGPGGTRAEEAGSIAITTIGGSLVVAAVTAWSYAGVFG